MKFLPKIKLFVLVIQITLHLNTDRREKMKFLSERFFFYIFNGKIIHTTKGSNRASLKLDMIPSLRKLLKRCHCQVMLINGI